MIAKTTIAIIIMIRTVIILINERQISEKISCTFMIKTIKSDVIIITAITIMKIIKLQRYYRDISYIRDK